MGRYGDWRTSVYAARVLQPVLNTLGDRGQHQLSLSGSVVLLSSLSDYCYYGSNRFYEFSLAGTVQAYLGYTYMF